MSEYSGIPITQLQPGGSVLSTDVYAAVDITDFTQSPVGSTKKYSISQLQSFIVNSFSGSALQSVSVATPSNLMASYNNGTLGVGATLTNTGTLSALVIDSISLSVGDRVLVANQSITSQNGIYVVTTVGNSVTAWVLTRASDFDNSVLGSIEQGDFVGVLFGDLYGLTFWFLTSATPILIGIAPIVFIKQATPGGEVIVNQTTAAVNIVPNTIYNSSAGASFITYTLPLTSAIGDYFEITGNDPGLYTIAQNAGQYLVADSYTTTPGPGGGLTSTLPHQNVRMRCIVADMVWTTVSIVGNFTFV